MEGNNRRKGKLAVMIAGSVAAMAVAVTAAAVATGGFHSDKAEAFELLAQMPDKLDRSYISEHIGLEQLGEQCARKGISQNIRISDLHSTGKLWNGAVSPEDLSQYVMQLDVLSDSSGQKSKMLLQLAKREDKMSAIVYQDEDKSCLAFPELTGKKLLVADHELLQEIVRQGQNGSTEDTGNDFIRALRSLVQDESSTLYDAVTVTEEGKEEYALTIPKDTLASVMADCCHFMSGQQEFTRFLDTCLHTDCLSVIKNAEDHIRESSSDVTFYVTGKEGNLSQIRASVTWQGKPVTVTMDFTGEEEAKAVIRVETTWKEERVQLELELKDRKTETCEESMELQFLIGDISFGKLGYLAAIDPEKNTYHMELELKTVGKEAAGLRAEGQIKNLNPGKSVGCTLDQVSLRVSGEEVLSAAMDLTLGVLEDGIEPPEGEEIRLDEREDFQDPETQAFVSELMKNGIPRLMQWGILDTDKLLEGIQGIKKGVAGYDDRL